MEIKHQAVQRHSNTASGQASSSKQQGRIGPTPHLDDEEHLPYTRPEARYHIADDTKCRLSIYQWPDNELENDVAYKVSLIS